MNAPIDNSPFPLHAYGVGELAILYNPHLTRRGAIMQLWRWINYHGVLRARLDTLGYRPGCRTFTPRQVACIVEHLGEP